MSGFKLNFESQFDILYAIFCFNFSLYWCCSWQTKKKKGNDQDLTKYLINDCSSFWIVHVSLWSTNCVVSCAECTLPPSKKVYSAPPPPPYFMKYFASILAYTGVVAGIQRKKKGNDQDLTKYLINDCSSFWIVHVTLWSTNCVVP